MNEIQKLPSVSDLQEWGDFAQKSGILPIGVTPFQAMAIVQAGREMGLQPLQALRSMSFIKNRLTMTVQVQLALAKQHLGVKIKDLKGDNGFCKVTLERGTEEITCEYSLEDARKAGLIRPDGGWEKYPRQMLRWRAIGDALRLLAPDFVMGFLSPDEAEGIVLEEEEKRVAKEANKQARKEVVESQKKLEERDTGRFTEPPPIDLQKEAEETFPIEQPLVEEKKSPPLPTKTYQTKAVRAFIEDNIYPALKSLILVGGDEGQRRAQRLLQTRIDVAKFVELNMKQAQAFMDFLKEWNTGACTVKWNESSLMWDVEYPPKEKP